MNQLSLWRGRYPWTSDERLLVRIARERREGIEVRYHFNGEPYPHGRA